MFRHLGRTITIIALCSAVGLQWIALQSIAWTTMIVRNAKQTSFCVAVKRTFDGANPCSLCHVVSKGNTSQQKRDIQTLTVKIDLACESRLLRLSPRSAAISYLMGSFLVSEIEHAPSVPPPRFFVS